jgi:molybdate/tungstate transport system substrate-binding protein
MQMTWQLEERRSANDPTRSRLEQRLLQHIDKQNVVPDEGDLLALLQARSVDYAFMYRSTAEDHRLKITTLDDEVNLGRSDLAPTYAQVSVSFTPNNGRAGQVMRGAPVTYGVTIPTQARNRAGARLLLQNLLGNKGQTLLKRRGFRPLQPARCAPCQGIDEALLTMLQKGES